jgi:hypothetical protein
LCWYHDNYPYENYSEHLWAVHLNKEIYKPYEKTTNLQYKVKLNDKLNNKEINNGINYSCVLYTLQSFQWEYFNWDPFHCFKNIISYFLDLMKNKREINVDSRKLCMAQHVHPLLCSEESCPYWVLSDDDMLLMDSIVASILIPKGVNCNDYRLTYPFRHTNYLKGYSNIVMVVTYLKFLLSFHTANSSSMASPYISFFCQFASDLTEILNPIIVKNEIPKLCLKVIETMTVYDFLFPDSEKPFAFMQLLDIVHFLEIGGPIRSQWCLFGERALGKIGKTVNSGGVNYLKNLFYKHVAHEIQVSSINEDEYYTNNIENDNFAMHLIHHDTISADSNKIELIFQKNFDYKKARLDELIKSAFDFLLVQEIDDLIALSSFFRVYSTFIHYYKKKSFVEWVISFTSNYDVENSKNQYSFDDAKNIDQIMNLSYNEGIIFKEDYFGIIQDLLSFVSKQSIEVYKKAVIKGIVYYYFKY